jgi:hypothetical protein
MVLKKTTTAFAERLGNGTRGDGKPRALPVDELLGPVLAS